MDFFLASLGAPVLGCQNRPFSFCHLFEIDILRIEAEHFATARRCASGVYAVMQCLCVRPSSVRFVDFVKMNKRGPIRAS